MKNLFFLSVLLFTSLLFSQKNSSIKGSVRDAAIKNEPMLFANIQLKGSDASYQTNFHGNYEITNIASGSHTLIISYAGYQTQEIDIVVHENETSKIETVLAPLQISFDAIEGMDTAKKTPSNSKK